MRSILRAPVEVLGHEEFPRFVRFIAVGATGAVVNLSIMYLLTTAGVHYLISGAIAIETAFLFNFSVNKVWTFRDVEIGTIAGVLRALARDHGVRLAGMGVNLAILWVLTDSLGVYYLISQALGAGVAAMWNFAGNVLWTWNA